MTVNTGTVWSWVPAAGSGAVGLGLLLSYFTVTVTHWLSSSDPSLPRTRNSTSNRVPDTKGAPRCTSKCAAPAPAGEVVSGPLTNQPDASVHTPSGLRSTARETVYCMFGEASWMLTVTSTAKVPWSCAVGAISTRPDPEPDTAVR